MRLIVFDIDDTLTKSENQHQSAFVDTMEEYGITKINDNWSDYLHHTDSFILKENYENNLPDQFAFDFISGFEEKMTASILKLDSVEEITGAKKMIKELSGRTEYAISFATGSLLKPALLKLDQAGINYHEQLVVGSNEIFEREGIVHESIQRAKAFHNVDSFDEIISVGDGIWDLTTAKNLGLHFMGIGMKNYPDFEKANVKLHIENWVNFDLEIVENLFL